MKTNFFKKSIPYIIVGMSLCTVGCESKKGNDVCRVDAIDASAWDSSSWISVVNAPVVTGKVTNGTRSADGASWFLSSVKNSKDVVAARWMTTGLGVYDIYINGEIIGNEILKPGFTHYEKTKLSFTYDVTGAMNTDKGDENIFSAQVTPGW